MNNQANPVRQVSERNTYVMLLAQEYSLMETKEEIHSSLQSLILAVEKRVRDGKAMSKLFNLDA
jgi:hypothetical protein